MHYLASGWSSKPKLPMMIPDSFVHKLKNLDRVMLDKILYTFYDIKFPR
jgi:hypothetical protein